MEQLLKENGVTFLSGKGRLLPGKKVEVTKDGETQIYEADAVVLAAGSEPVLLPLPGVLTSDELFQLREIPEHLVVIGGGVISVEFATVYSSLAAG